LFSSSYLFVRQNFRQHGYKLIVFTAIIFLIIYVNVNQDSVKSGQNRQMSKYKLSDCHS